MGIDQSLTFKTFPTDEEIFTKGENKNKGIGGKKASSAGAAVAAARIEQRSQNDIYISGT